MPIAAWQTQASLNLNDLPSSFSICSSLFLKSWVADWNADINFFEILNEEGKLWAHLYLEVPSTALETEFYANIGREDDKVQIDASGTLPIFFPQSWIRSCITLDTAAGMVRIVVDGKVVEDASHPKMKNLADKMPRNSTIRVGKGAGINALFTDLNIFSEPLSLEKMVAITTPGHNACGSRGDFLNWDDAEWTLSDKWGDSHWKDWVLVVNASKMEELEWIRGPCWRPSKIKVYQLTAVHDQSFCMKHCQKISNGRSPPLVTKEEWTWLADEVAAISNLYGHHSHLWLAATEGDSGEPINSEFI